MKCYQCPFYVPQESYCAHLTKQVDPEKPQCKTPPLPQIPLWSYKTGGLVWAVAWSPDGFNLAAGSGDGRVYVFSASGERLWSYKTDSPILSVAWSPDGSRLAASSENKIIYVFGSLAIVRAILRKKLYRMKILLNLI
ncbi:hypothetical protein DRP04_16155 [Archaeoglobales archaeon]|nr:MAG: hypothetical protein DRP04_16155 [Archaeoglobales archaeon]